jgi:hypothetical protein
MNAPDCDRLIDTAAARLTRGAPPAAWRERVLARVAAEGRRSRIWIWAPAAAFGVLLASAAGAIALQRAVSPEFPVVERAAQIRGAGLDPWEESKSSGLKTAASSWPGVADSTEAGRGSDGSRSLPTDRETEAAPSAALLAWRERALPALPAVADLTMPDIQPETIGVTQLEVKPLAGAAPFDGASDAGGVR